MYTYKVHLAQAVHDNLFCEAMEMRYKKKKEQGWIK